MPYPRDLSYNPETRVVLVGTTVCPRDEINLPPLPHVKRNIDCLARLFADPDIVGLPPETIIPIVDRQEASAILTDIAAAAAAATDTLIVYYAGHGLYGDQSAPLYLTAKNTTSATKAFSGVRITDVKNALRTSRARKRILILDCCYSGRAFEGGMGVAEDDVRAAIDVAGTYGIAAVPGDHKALAPAGEPLTKFTQTFVDVLERGIPGAMPVLTVDEVFNAIRQVAGRDAMPLPEADNWNEGGSFRLVKNRYLQLSKLENSQKIVETELQAAAVPLPAATRQGLEAIAPSVIDRMRVSPTIFLSYARQDRHCAERLAAMFAARGLSVWWDRNIPAGRSFERVIEEALGQAQIVVVLWSRSSVESDWVRAEASYALEANKLLPLNIDGVRLPLRFRPVQTLGLASWSEAEDGSEWARLFEEIDERLASLEEAARLEEEARAAEEARRQAEKEQAELQARQAEEAARLEQEARAAEEARQAEKEQAEREARQAKEARREVERQRQAEESARLEQEARAAEEARRQAEKERAEREARQAEEGRREAERQRQAEEAARLEQEVRAAEEARRLAEKEQAELEARQAEEARRKAEKEQAEQEARQAEEARREVERLRQAEEAARLEQEARSAEGARRQAEKEQAEREVRQAEQTRVAPEHQKEQFVGLVTKQAGGDRRNIANSNLLRISIAFLALVVTTPLLLFKSDYFSRWVAPSPYHPASETMPVTHSTPKPVALLPIPSPPGAAASNPASGPQISMSPLTAPSAESMPNIASKSAAVPPSGKAGEKSVPNPVTTEPVPAPNQVAMAAPGPKSTFAPKSEPTMAPTESAPVGTSLRTIVKTALRQQPDNSAKILADLKSGTEVAIAGMATDHDWYEVKAPNGASIGFVRADAVQETSVLETADWHRIEKRNDAAAFAAFLRKYPRGSHAEAASARLSLLRRAAAQQPTVRSEPINNYERVPSETLSSGRCTSIIERSQLGEQISDADREMLRSHCR